MILASDKEMICGGTYLHEMTSMDLVLCIRYVMQLIHGSSIDIRVTGIGNSITGSPTYTVSIVHMT